MLIKYLSTAILSLLSISGFLGNIYVSMILLPKSLGKREKLGWVVMIIMTLSSFMLCLIWMIWEPLARTAIPTFVIGCAVIGFLFRESAISPYKLASFWRTIGKKELDKKEDVAHKNQ